jgi:hypothetical protein
VSTTELSAGGSDREDSIVTDAVRASFSQLEAKLPSEVEILLCPPFVELRTLRGLPPVKKRDLVCLIREQRKRFFRACPDAVAVSAQWDKGEGGEKVARAALADEARLESIEEVVRAAGLRVSMFRAARERGDSGIPLLTASQRSFRGRRTRRTAVGALSVVVGGWLVPPAVYVADLARDHQALAAELAGMDSSVTVIDSLEGRVAAFAAVAGALRRQSADSAWVSEALVEILSALPSNVHLHGAGLERAGVVRLHMHSNSGAEAWDSVSARWPGARVEGDEGAAEFVVELETRP